MAKAFKQLNNRKKLSGRIQTFNVVAKKSRSASEKAISLSMVQSSDKVVNSCNRAALEALNVQCKAKFVRG